MPQELTGTQRKVLRGLCERQPQILSELAMHIGKSAKAVSNAVKLLEAMGYAVSKTAEDEPGRPKYVSLTAKGEGTCKESLEKKGSAAKEGHEEKTAKKVLKG